MGSFFNYENSLLSKLAKVCDTVTLGVLWVFCSLPIVTMGAATSALYYAYNRSIRQELGYAWKTFFEAFKSNFKQATQIWLIILGIMLLWGLDSYLLYQMGTDALWVQVLLGAITAVGIFAMVWGLYLFPYLSRFALPNKAVMKNCALLLLANMPQSLLLLVLFAACVVGFICLPVLNLLIPALYILCANPILEKIFRKYMRHEDLQTQQENAT